MIMGTVPLAIQEPMRMPMIIMVSVGAIQIFPPYSIYPAISSQDFPLMAATASVTAMDASRLICTGISSHTTERIMEISRNRMQNSAQPKGIF